MSVIVQKESLCLERPYSSLLSLWEKEYEPATTSWFAHQADSVCEWKIKEKHHFSSETLHIGHELRLKKSVDIYIYICILQNIYIHIYVYQAYKNPLLLKKNQKLFWRLRFMSRRRLGERWFFWWHSLVTNDVGMLNNDREHNGTIGTQVLVSNTWG